MKRLLTILGGLLLIGTGIMLFFFPQGLFFNVQPIFALLGFLTLAAISLIIYFTAGEKHFGWLFPVGVFTGLAAIIGASMLKIDNPIMVIPLFIGIAFPFIVVYFEDRQTHWWALIPAGVMVFIMLVLFLSGIKLDQLIPSGLFLVLTLVFAAIFFLRKFIWAAITAYVMFAMIFVPMLAETTHPELTAIWILAAVAIPFFFVYFRDPVKRWWAIIPAGIITSAAVSVLVTITFLPNLLISNIGIPNAIMLVGMAVTFGFLWLRYQKRWGFIVALIAIIIAGLQIIVNDQFLNRWPLILLGVGIFLLVKALLPAKKTEELNK